MRDASNARLQAVASLQLALTMLMGLATGWTCETLLTLGYDCKGRPVGQNSVGEDTPEYARAMRDKHMIDIALVLCNAFVFGLGTFSMLSQSEYFNIFMEKYFPRLMKWFKDREERLRAREEEEANKVYFARKAVEDAKDEEKKKKAEAKAKDDGRSREDELDDFEAALEAKEKKENEAAARTQRAEAAAKAEETQEAANDYLSRSGLALPSGDDDDSAYGGGGGGGATRKRAGPGVGGHMGPSTSGLDMLAVQKEHAAGPSSLKVAANVAAAGSSVPHAGQHAGPMSTKKPKAQTPKKRETSTKKPELKRKGTIGINDQDRKKKQADRKKKRRPEKKPKPKPRQRRALKPALSRVNEAGDLIAGLCRHTGKIVLVKDLLAAGHKEPAHLDGVPHEQVRMLIQTVCDVTNLRHIFDEVDVDDDQHVTPKEFSDFVKVCGDKFPGGVVHPTEKTVRMAFDFVDKDRNGVLDYREFEYWLGMAEEQCYKRVRKVIQTACDLDTYDQFTVDKAQWDADKVTEPEFEAFVHNCVAAKPELNSKKLADSDINAAFNHVDTKGKGTIDRDEFDCTFDVTS